MRLPCATEDMQRFHLLHQYTAVELFTSPHTPWTLLCSAPIPQEVGTSGGLKKAMLTLLGKTFEFGRCNPLARLVKRLSRKAYEGRGLNENSSTTHHSWHGPLAAATKPSQVMG